MHWPTRQSPHATVTHDAASCASTRQGTPTERDCPANAAPVAPIGATRGAGAPLSAPAARRPGGPRVPAHRSRGGPARRTDRTLGYVPCQLGEPAAGCRTDRYGPAHCHAGQVRNAYNSLNKADPRVAYVPKAFTERGAPVSKLRGARTAPFHGPTTAARSVLRPGGVGRWPSG